MDKIARVALQAKFMTDDLNGIMEVVNNTPNARHALELILGVYEEPKFNKIGTYTYKYKGEAFKNLSAEFNSYNPWTEELYVKVTRPITREIGIFKEFDEIVNKDNYTEYELTSDVLNKTDRDLWRWKNITLDETETRLELVSMEDYSNWFEMNMEC
jgi:hypothetical protein